MSPGSPDSFVTEELGRRCGPEAEGAPVLIPGQSTASQKPLRPEETADSAVRATAVCQDKVPGGHLTDNRWAPPRLCTLGGHQRRKKE